MAKYTYYYPDGNPISNFKAFVEFYDKLYFYLNPDRKLEKRMDDILRDGISTNDDEKGGNDVVDIFRWKIGATDYCYNPLKVYNQYHPKANSQKGKEENPLLLDGVWKIVKETGGRIDGDRTKEIFCRIRNASDCTGIGATYALTVIYFLTGGKYPIYDRFAYIALTKIRNSESEDLFDGSGFLKGELFQKDEFTKCIASGKKPETIFDAYVENYKAPLEAWLKENNAEYSRTVDRALWTYGHLFNENIGNEKRMQK